MNKHARRIETWLRYVSPTECVMIGNALIWTIWVFWPDDNLFTASPIYRQMAQWAPAQIWGLAFALLSVAHILALILHQWDIRRTLIIAQSALAIILGIGFLTSNANATGGGTYCILGVAYGILYLRLGADIRHEQASSGR